MAFTPPAVDEIEEKQPKFIPPAATDIDVEANLQETAYDRYKLAVAQGATPENYAELPGMTPAQNPDYDFPRQAGVVPYVGQAISAVQEHLIEPVAAQIFTSLKRGTSADIPPTEEQEGKGAAALNLAPIEPGKPMLTLPKLTPEEMEAATPAERAIAGVGEGISGVYESFSTPGNALMLPLSELKPVQAMYGAQMAMAVPDSLKAIAEAKTPEEVGKAYTSLAANLTMGTMLAHSATKKGVPRASENAKTTEVHGDVSAQSRQGQGQMPLEEGGAGVQPRTWEEGKVSLSPEATGLLEPHWDDDKHAFTTLGDGRFMVADHETGKILVDPVEFQAWLDNDLKGLSPKKKAAAVKAFLDHEEIHLYTDPALGEPYWNSLSPFEQNVLKRQYLKGAEGESARNLGMEAIRNRVERARGMTRTDFIGMALKERWTARSLDFLADIVGKIRRLKSKELSASQNAALDRVLENIKAARGAVAQPGEIQQEEQPAPEEAPRTAPPAEALTEAQLDDIRSLGLSDEDIQGMSLEQQKSLLGDKLPTPGLAEGPFARRNAKGEEIKDDLEGPLPPLYPGERVVLVKRPDGSLYRASYAGKKYDMSAGGPAMVEKYGTTHVDSIGTINDRGEWSHGVLPKGDKIITEFSPYAAVERSGEPEGPAARRASEYAEEEAQKLDEEAARLRAAGMHQDADELAAMAKTLRQKTSEESFPAARRKTGKAGEQEEMFGAVTKKGIPGGEDVQATSAAQAGAIETLPEQKIFPQEIPFDPTEQHYAEGSSAMRPISPTEAKSERALGKILTLDARKGGSTLPVSMTKRVTALFDRTDGSVHVVSTYPVPREKGYEPLIGPRLTGKTTSNTPAENPIAYMVDPELAGKERPNRPADELLHRYQPIYSFLLREPKQNFHQKFVSMADFQGRFLDEAKVLAREHSSGFGGIPEAGKVGAAEPEYALKEDRYAKGAEPGSRVAESSTPFRFPSEKEPNLPRPLESELRAFHDFFGDNPPSDALMFNRRIEKEAANAPRAMINAIRKLARIERAQTRGLSEGEAIGRVIDKLYENYSNSDTRSDFIKRTTEQNRVGPPEAVPEGGTGRKIGVTRELSTARDVAPTTVRGLQGPRPLPPEPRLSEPKAPEKLTAEEQAALDAEIRKHVPPQFEVSPRTTLGKQALETKVPKEPYRVGESKSIELTEKERQEVEDQITEEDERYKKQKELFPERDVMSMTPEELDELDMGGSGVESLAQEKKVVAKGEGNKGQLDFFKQQGPAGRRRAEKFKEDTADAVNVLSAYVKRKATEDKIAATRDAVDAKYAIAADQVDKEIRLVTADKKMPEGNREVLKAAPTVVQAGAYIIDYPIPDALKGDVLVKMRADPIYRNIQNMFASPDAIDKAKAGGMLKKLKRETVLKMVDDGEIDWHTGVVKYDKGAYKQLEKFNRHLDTAESKARNIIASKGGGLQGVLDRRAAAARLKAVGDMREQLKYAEQHWNEPELQDTAAKMVVELEAQHRNERDNGMKVKRSENYLPGRYEEQWFDGDRIQFMEGPRILGKSFRMPHTFNNYYEAIAAGNYLPFNMDGAALVAHRVRQGMRQIETRLWEKSLKTLADPHSGMPMVASLKDGVAPSPEYVVHTFDGGRQMAVHKGSLDIIKAITGESAIQNSPATRFAMQLSQKMKHTILFGDTFHLGRLKAYDWAINGIGKGGYRGGLSILEYRPESVAEAVRKGLVRPEDAAWADGTIDVHLPKGDTTVTRRQIGNMFLQRGLNAGRIADAIFKVEGGTIGKYNKFLFDKFTRGLMMETAVKEFERMNRDNIKTSNGNTTSRYDYRKIVDDIARDTNNFMGSIGRQGWIKNQTFQDIFRMFGLSPQWVEGLIKKEIALPGRVSGLSYLAGRRNVPLLGTAGRGVARGLATMFAVTQAINLITRRQPTWKNEEEGHKWDAWIPDVTGKGEGFFISPLSLFNEVTHDIIRLTETKPTVYNAIKQIGENKLGPYGRAAMIFATGETPDHRKITSTGGMVKEMGKALIPVPISLSKGAQWGLSKVGLSEPPEPGSVQRQAMASVGVKTEPATTANSQIYRKADEFVKDNGIQKGTGWTQVQTDELGYSDLRQSVAAGNKRGFKEALEKLRETRTDDEIHKAMKTWNHRAFTGSKAAEKYFVSGLTDKELDLYSRARVERQKMFNDFETMLVDDLTKGSAPSK